MKYNILLFVIATVIAAPVLAAKDNRIKDNIVATAIIFNHGDTTPSVAIPNITTELFDGYGLDQLTEVS